MLYALLGMRGRVWQCYDVVSLARNRSLRVGVGSK